MIFENLSVLWLLLALPFLLAGLGLGGWLAKREFVVTFRLNARRLQRSQVAKYGMAAILMGLLVAALALPKVAFTTIGAAKKTGEIALLVDVSASMGARQGLDSPSRLERAKPILYEIVDRMEGLGEVRISLHGSTSIARSLVPLVGVEDYPYLKESISKLLDVQSTPGTGSSLGRPILNVEAKFPEDQRVKLVVLLSDGETFLGVTRGVSDVERGWIEEAVKKAGEEGIKVITVGIGEPEGARIPLYDTEGSFSGAYQKLQGIDYVSYLEEAGLKEVAVRTRGRYFSERDREELIAYIEENLSPEATGVPEEFLDYRYVAHWFVLGALPVWVVLARRHLLK